MNPRLALATELLAALQKAAAQQQPLLASIDLPTTAQELTLERPREFAHGDFSCPLALQVAKQSRQNPRLLAQAIADCWQESCAHLLTKVEVAGPGFLNLTLNSNQLGQTIHHILQQAQHYGYAAANPQAQPILIEFVSANPTGPLHVGHGRQGVLGDTLAAILQTQGQPVQREFYYNDAGMQIHNLTLSVQARARGLGPNDSDWPENGYRGDYITDIAHAYLQSHASLDDEAKIRDFSVAYLRAEQDRDLFALGVKFDHYYLESSLYTDGKVAHLVQRLEASGQTYHHDGALWLKTTDKGDDKDRVIEKSGGGYTYFVPDVAYHEVKWQRGFERAINIQGSDHHGTIARVRAGLQALALDIPTDYPEYVLHKMVTVMKGGQEIKISKRAGSYVTLRDLIEWSGIDPIQPDAPANLDKGRDAVRFFFASRKADTEFVFDVDQALAQSEDNPVYYVQYAHARINALLLNWGGERDSLIAQAATYDFSGLTEESEITLIRRLQDYPATLTRAAHELAPHHLAFYLRQLAAELHSYYNRTRILVSPEGLKQARLLLILAVQQTLKNGLTILGVSAPDRM